MLIMNYWNMPSLSPWSKQKEAYEELISNCFILRSILEAANAL
jgi:hypothetical protein